VPDDEAEYRLEMEQGLETLKTREINGAEPEGKADCDIDLECEYFSDGRKRSEK
jgi:hypothetical protein